MAAFAVLVPACWRKPAWRRRRRLGADALPEVVVAPAHRRGAFSDAAGITCIDKPCAGQ